MSGTKKEKSFLFRVWENAVARKNGDTCDKSEALNEKETEPEKKTYAAYTINGEEPDDDMVSFIQIVEMEELIKNSESQNISDEGQETESDDIQDEMAEDDDEETVDEDVHAESEERPETDEEDSEQDAAQEEEPDAAKPIDARIYVKSARNDMEAWMIIYPPEEGGKEISKEAVMDALDNAGIKFGIDEKLIEQAVNEELYIKLLIVARGQKPVDGEDGKVVDHYSRKSWFDDLESQKVDYKEKKNRSHVEEGDIICDIIPPVQSIDGSSVKGEILKGIAVSMPPVPQGKNTQINEEKTALVSTMTGTLSFKQQLFEVNQEMDIMQNVDLSVGNIDMVGNLDIKGDVLSGFSIKATGNVNIRGMVGNSKIEAGGSIKIGMGMKGNGDAVLTAGENIQCGYMENCKIAAGKEIKANSIINCETVSDESIEAQQVVGGIVSAKHRIRVKTLGNMHRRQTVLVLGNTSEDQKIKEALEKNIKELKKNMAKAEKNIIFLNSKANKTEQEKAMYQNFIGLYSQMDEQIKKDAEKLKEIKAGNEDTKQIEAVINMLYPPAVIKIFDEIQVINEERSMCRITFFDGKINIS